MDEYVVKKCLNGNGSYFYYKNNQLHREVGPAIVTLENKEECINLGDENLYKEEIISEEFPHNYNREYINEIEMIDGRLAQVYTIPIFYLHGKPYSYKNFEEILEKLELKNELMEELPTTQNNTKKPKV